MAEKQYELARAQAYWRHAPSGKGKHDTSGLADASEDHLLSVWDEAFRSRFRAYPEEDVFLRVFSQSVAGQRMLSVGSGLGFHEIFYRSRGAQVTCADIVPTNLKVIARVSALKGLPGIRTLLLDDRSRGFPNRYDTAFIYGSLMAMPRDEQRALLARASAALAPEGRIVLMLYTWEFVRRTCGWGCPDEFDPVVFARASDPSVGAEDCPWSDWHDDASVLELAGPEFRIARRQTWNDEVYVWYELRRGTREGKPAPFFDQQDRYAGLVVHRVPGADFVAADAVKEVSSGGRFTTGRNRSSYAALSPVLSLDDKGRPNAVDVLVDLESGCVSIGVLDVGLGIFVATSVVTTAGPNRVRLLVPTVPRQCQIVISNHHPDLPAESAFAVQEAEFVTTELAEPPSGVLPSLAP